MYFESQCIPTPLAWYAHHLPQWYLKLNTVFANISELVVPFLFFFPIRKIRIVAFYWQVSKFNKNGFGDKIFTKNQLSFQVFLQVHIIATGNYNFFNLLTICLCISLLDDHFFYRKKSRNENSKILELFSTVTCIGVYAGILYGTYIYYNLRLTENWTITSKIGNHYS